MILADIESRKQIYAPTYAKAVENTAAFQRLRKIYEENAELILWGGFTHVSRSPYVFPDPFLLITQIMTAMTILLRARLWSSV